MLAYLTYMHAAHDVHIPQFHQVLLKASKLKAGVCYRTIVLYTTHCPEQIAVAPYNGEHQDSTGRDESGILSYRDQNKTKR
jgi:hypothetical protein